MKRVLLLLTVSVLAIVGCGNQKGNEDNLSEASTNQQEPYKETVKQGDSYMEKGEYSKAEDSYQEALTLNPESKEAYIGLSALYWEQLDIENFINIVEKGKKALPEEEEYFSFIEKLYEEYSRYKAYTDVFEEKKEQGSGADREPYYIRSYGFCFEKLLDFDQDDIEELVISYTKSPHGPAVPGESSYIDDYMVEIWSFQNGQAENLFVGEAIYGYEDADVCFVTEAGETFLIAGDGNGTIGYYCVQDGELQKESEKSGHMDVYCLQGYEIDRELNVSWDGTWSYAWDEMHRTENRIYYKLDATRYAIDRALNGKNNDSEECIIGNYLYEAADKSIYVSGYRDAENKPALTVRYWTAEQEGDLKFVYNEEKKIYDLDESCSGKDVAISVEDEEGKLHLCMKGSTVGGEITAELLRETQYDGVEMEQNRKTEDDSSQTDGEKTYQLDEEGVAYAVQKFLDEKEFQTLNKAIDYFAGSQEEVFKYNEAYWVPIYEGVGTEEVAYYTIVASSAFENAGEAKIYPAEVYDVIENNKNASDFKEIEIFNVKTYVLI